MTRLFRLLLVCTGLAGVITLEISNAPSGDVERLQTRATTAAARAPQPAINRTRDWVTAVLARPLFSPDRRPAANATSVAGSSLPGLPRLAPDGRYMGRTLAQLGERPRELTARRERPGDNGGIGVASPRRAR